jgi:hypothetical protein
VALLLESADELERLEATIEADVAAHASRAAASSERLAAILRDVEARTSALLAHAAPETESERSLEAIERSKLLIDIRTHEWRIARMELDDVVRAARDDKAKALLERWRRILDPHSQDVWRDAAADGLVIGLTQAGGPALEILLKIRERALQSQHSFDTTDRHLDDLFMFCAHLEDWCAASRATRMELEREP